MPLQWVVWAPNCSVQSLPCFATEIFQQNYWNPGWLPRAFAIWVLAYTMRNIIEIREIRESNYEISEFVHTLLQKVRKRVHHLEFHQKCVRTLAFTDFLNSCPIICKSLRKLCKSGKVFIVCNYKHSVLLSRTQSCFQ